MDQTAFVFLVFDQFSDPETHSGTELYCPVRRHENGLFWDWARDLLVTGQSLQPLVPPCRFTTYLPQHNFDSATRFPFTQRWPTVVLPLQAHVQPKSASCLDMNFFLVLATKLPFLSEVSTFSCFFLNSWVFVITDLTMLDWRSSS